jgi:hypothetical protein
MVQKGAAAGKDPAVRRHLNSGCHSVDTKGASDQGRASRQLERLACTVLYDSIRRQRGESKV